jgi:hypothetical protein
LAETKEEHKKRGKRSRAAGRKFELDTRRDLESRGYIVCKWCNTVDLINMKLTESKPKFNPFTRMPMMISSGFPDFIAYKQKEKGRYNVLGVESKSGKTGLDKKEKEMATWLLDNNIFSKFYTSRPIKVGRRKQVVYQKFER